MSPSIRTFLLINLLLSVTLVTSLAIIGNLFLDHRDIQSHLDSQLTLTALTIQALLSDYHEERDFQKIRSKISKIPAQTKRYYAKQTEDQAKPVYEEKLQFQVWDPNGNLLLRSSHAPSKRLSTGSTGFSDQVVKDDTWRVFTLHSRETGLTVIVSERYNFREELEGRITRDSIYIMLLTYPFLGLLIWVIVGRGLEIVGRVATEVRHRAPSFLEPVDLESVPTEIQPLVDELNKLFKRLREAIKREKRFAGDAAHELRTPLAALRAHAQVALKEKDEKSRKETLRKLLKCVDRSTHVVQQLLTLNRMMPQATLENETLVDLHHLAAEIIAEIFPAAMKKKSEVELIAPDEPATLMGNPTALGILIRNLVDNAIRYSPPSSKIIVAISFDKKQVKLCVTDNGPGIPEELHGRVFERFFRILGNKSTGSGLGLGIVQQIAELHRAELQLGKPDDGTGLKVSIIFPRKSKVR